MGNIKFGSGAISDIKFGSATVSKIYIGTDLVWPIDTTAPTIPQNTRFEEADFGLY